MGQTVCLDGTHVAGPRTGLIDKVCSKHNLRVAFERVKKNGGSAGVDHQTIERFESRREENLDHLAQSLRDGSYQPQALKRAWATKPGQKEKRPLGVPIVRHQVAQTALLQVLEPIFERDLAKHSYGFRSGRGCQDALHRVEALLKTGYTWVVDADLRSYFDTIPHSPLQDLVKAKVSDHRLLDRWDDYLKQGVMETVKPWTPVPGTPQGVVISPWLSNIYLDPLDQLMSEAGFEMVRSADDFVILGRSPAEAQDALEVVQQWTVSAGLTLHPDKTQIVDATQPGGFGFLGYHLERGHRWLRRKSLKRFKGAIRAKTRRSNGYSLEAIVLDVNRVLKGWLEYFKHSHKTTFSRLTSWLRMRLRSILRKRRGGRGRGRGLDHQRWPNAFFTELGLFSLAAAHILVCQSSRRRTTDRRAVCGKTARPVRRGVEPGMQPVLPTSIRSLFLS